MHEKMKRYLTASSLIGSGGAAPVESPITILGDDLVAWWTVDDIIAGPVANWPARFGGYTLSPASEAAQPAYTAHSAVDYYPGVAFDAVDDSLELLDITGFPVGNDPGSLFAVYYKASDTGTRGHFAYGDSAARGRRSIYQNTSTPSGCWATDGTSNIVASGLVTGFPASNLTTVLTPSIAVLDFGAANAEKIYFDGYLDTTASATGAYATGTSGGFIVGRDFTAASGFSSLFVREIVIASSAMSDAKRQELEGHFARKYRSTQLMVPTHPAYSLANVVAEGDSITAAADSYAVVGRTLSTNDRVAFTKRAVGGSTMATMTARAAGTNAAQIAGMPNILTILIGTNDFGADGDTPATFLSQLETYLDAAILAGWRTGTNKIVLSTLTPRTGPPGFPAWRATANAGISALIGVKADYLVDFTANPIMGPDAAAADTLLYSDGLHPTALGQTYLAQDYKTMLNALLP